MDKYPPPSSGSEELNGTWDNTNTQYGSVLEATTFPQMRSTTSN